MQYFETYTSNTLAGSGNQTVFYSEMPNTWQTGRLFYRLFRGGRMQYSLLFADTLDSTFSDGSVSRKNQTHGGWELKDVSVGICADGMQVQTLHPLTFAGESAHAVRAGELFWTDPILLDAPQGAYLCVELRFRGRCIPHHEETLLPTFVLQNGEWVSSTHVPFPSMIGCDREVSGRVAFLGDSITQGIGTEKDSYAHWCARLAERLGSEYAYWNLGLGFARADDAASDGAWLNKAKQAQAVFLCLGVNDLLQGFSAEQVKQSLQKTVGALKQRGIRVLIQTLPPFDYTGKLIDAWQEVNRFIRETLAEQCDALFDVVPVLGKSESEPYRAKYGGHPDAAGCLAWAEALLPTAKEFLHKLAKST